MWFPQCHWMKVQSLENLAGTEGDSELALVPLSVCLGVFVCVCACARKERRSSSSSCEAVNHSCEINA